MLAQNVLDEWLPGGVCAVFVICLKPSEWNTVDAKLKQEFPGMVPFQAYDFRNKGTQLAHYEALPFPVSNRVQHDIMTRASGVAHDQIVSGGAIGCAETHFLIWKSVADRPGWTVVFETDACWAHDGPVPRINEPKITNDAVPGMIMLGTRLVFGKGDTRPIPSIPNGTFVEARGKWFGMDGYAIRNASVPDYLSALVPIEGHIDLVLSRMAAINKIMPIWRAEPRWTGVKPSTHSNTGGNILALRRSLPDDNAATNAIIIVPWAILFALIIVLIALASSSYVLMRKKKCK